MNRISKIIKQKIDPIVEAIAISNFLKLDQDLANLKILNNLSDLKAAMAVKDFLEIDEPIKFNICSTREIMTIKESKMFSLSLK